MSVLAAKEQHLLILADIAMAAAIGAHDAGFCLDTGGEAYVPGSLRERWLAGTGDPAIRSRVVAMASAAAGPLQGMSADRLVATAGKYGIALDPATAQGMADYFEAKRNAVLSYNR